MSDIVEGKFVDLDEKAAEEAEEILPSRPVTEPSEQVPGFVLAAAILLLIWFGFLMAVVLWEIVSPYVR